MLKALRILPALTLSAGLAVSAQADGHASADTVLARVNGVEITMGHLIIAQASLPEQYQALPSDVLFNGILDQLIQQAAMSQSFQGEVPTRIELQLENERRSLLAGEVVEGVMAKAASEAEIQDAYDAQFANAEGGTEYNASHILVENEDEAKTIVEDLRAGADFAETAKIKSTGPSGPNGGALGWFGTGRMVPEFEAAVVALDVGAISDPVQTQFGWHVIILNEKRVKSAPKLDDVRDQIAQTLRQSAVEAHIQALVADADIERPEIDGLDVEMIRNLDLLD